MTGRGFTVRTNFVAEKLLLFVSCFLSVDANSFWKSKFPSFQLGKCGRNLLWEDFNEYGGSYQPWSLEDAKLKWPSGDERAAGTGEVLKPGVYWGKGWDRSAVGEGHLRILQPTGGVKTAGSGLAFDFRLQQPIPEATLEYKFKFEDGYEFMAGGKLPGMCSEECPSGCGGVSEGEGWNSRVMWRRGGSLMSYMHWFDKSDNCGDNWHFDQNIKAGEWYTIKIYVRVNTPGQEDGIQMVWLNGKKVQEMTHALAADDKHLVEKFTFRNFHGGSGKKFASPKDQYVYFDDIKLNEGACQTGALPAARAVELPEISVGGDDDDNTGSDDDDDTGGDGVAGGGGDDDDVSGDDDTSDDDDDFSGDDDGGSDSTGDDDDDDVTGGGGDDDDDVSGDDDDVGDGGGSGGADVSGDDDDVGGGGGGGDDDGDDDTSSGSTRTRRPRAPRTRRQRGG